MRCKSCGVRTRGCMGFCRTCKWARHHAWERVKAEGLLVDTAGGSWWVWDSRGEILAGPSESRFDVMGMLARGLGPFDGEAVVS